MQEIIQTTIYTITSNIEKIQHSMNLDGWNLFLTVISYAIAIAIWIDLYRNRKSIAPYFKKIYKTFLKVIKQAKKDVWDNHCYLNNPVLRDRWLFSGEKNGIVTFSITVAVLVPLVVLAVTAFFSILNILTSYVGINIGGDSSASTLGIYDTNNADKTNLLWAILTQYMDPGNLNNSDGVGSIVAFVIATSGIVCLTGLLVSAIVNIVSQRTERWKKGLIQYNENFENYIVIIGINEQVPSIIRRTFENNIADYVLIQTRKDVEKARMALELKLEDIYEDKVIFYAGERTSIEDIEKLNLKKAIEVYILGEDMNSENEKDHDAFNMSCLEHISINMSKDDIKSYRENNIIESYKRLKCHVDFEYQSTYTIFKSTHIYRDIDAKDIEFLPFNVHEIWAKKVLVQNYALIQQDKNERIKVQRYLPLDAYWQNKGGKRTLKYIETDSEKTVHLFVLGMNQMGTALATQAALITHLPNYEKDTQKKLRTTITFIDDNAIKEAEFFMGRFGVMFELCRHKLVDIEKDDIYKSYNDPISNQENRFSHLGENFMDIQWEFIKGNVANSKIKKYIANCCKSSKETCTIAVCFNNPQQSIAPAMYFPEDILKEALQILVYQQNSFDMIEKVAHGEKQWKRYEKLKPFGLIENSYEGSIFDNLLAKLIYYKFKSSSEVQKQIQNDTIRVDRNLISEVNRLWDELGIVDKLSNIDLADSLELKLRSARTLKTDTKTKQKEMLSPKCEDFKLYSFAEHNRWLTERLTMGYRPLNKKEWNIYFEKEERQNTLRELFKSKSRAHVDICSNVDLDNKVEKEKKHSNDESFLQALPLLLELKERIILFERDEHSLTNMFVKDLVHVKGGTMDIEADEESKRAKKTITCGSFNMSKYPVTQEMWNSIYGYENNPSTNKGDRLPLENVSLNEVFDFLLILEDRTGLRFSIPTVDEWEYAARGGVNNNTYKYSGSDVLSEVAWSHTNSTHEVGTKPKANSLGIYDMSGNVWEWTKSPFDASSFYFCGGSWKFTDHWCNLYECYGSWTPDFKSPDLGFRLILPLTLPVTKVEEDRIFEISDTIETLLAEHFEKIPSGKFKMGLPENSNFEYKKKKLDVTAEQPQHEVNISEFFIGKTVVTQRIWKTVMGSNPSLHKGDDYPVENVSFISVQEFLEKLNKNEDLKETLKKKLGLKEDVLFRLPTEAEWEYAARGGETNDKVLFAGSSDADEVAWHIGLTKTTQPVAKKSANGYGLYDMSGNVWEWCNDWFIRNYYNICQEKGIVDNPGGPEGPRSTRVFRGGSWKYTADECRVTRPGYWIEEYSSPDLGFRIAIGKEIKYDKISAAEK